MALEIRTFQAVRDFLLEPGIFGHLREMAEKYKLPEDRVEEFLDLADAVIDGKLKLAQMPDMIAAAFGVDAETAKKISADLAGYRLLPLDLYLPGVADQIAAWGGEVADYPTKRVGKEKETPDKFIQELAEKLDLELPENLMQRFEYLAKGYLTKQRAKDATKKILMRRLNLGGLEFSEAMVDNLFRTLDAEAKHIEFVDQLEDAEEVAIEAPAPVEEPAAPKPVSQKVSANNKSVPDHARVFKQKRMISKKAFLDMLAKYTVEPPKKLVKATKVALKEMKKPEVSASKIETEKKMNMALAPIVQLFREKNLSSVAFRDVTTGYIKNERSAQQTREHLDEVGNFTDAEKDSVLKTLEDARRLALVHKVSTDDGTSKGVKIISKPTPIERPVPVDLGLPVERETHALTTSVPVISGLDLHEDELEEIERTKKQMKKRGQDKPAKLDKETQKKVNAALQPMVKIFKKKRMPKKAFQDISMAHVRGIREKHQSEALLKDKYQLEGSDLDAVMQALEAARKVIHESEGAKPSASSADQKDIFAQEKEVLNRRHAAVTGKVSDEDIEPVLPGAKVSAARSKEEELAMQKGVVTDEQMKMAHEASKPKKAKAKVSAQTVVDQKKKVTDVTVARRLVGPVEELGTMRPAEFRRLSSDPKEAARKIFDKLDLLESTSYEERIKGVRAWRKSPINTLYRQMASEALKQGKSIAEIAAERRNVGKESLAPNEIQAIVELNGKVKF